MKKLWIEIVIDHCVFRYYIYQEIDDYNTSICVKTRASLPHTPYIILYVDSYRYKCTCYTRIWTITLVRIVFYEFRRYFRRTKSIRVILPVLSKTFSFYVAIFMNCKQLYTQTTGIKKTKTFFVSFSLFFFSCNILIKMFYIPSFISIYFIFYFYVSTRFYFFKPPDSVWIISILIFLHNKLQFKILCDLVLLTTNLYYSE